ncbi:SDR family oxidoreductase [Virgibacillus sp. DJP39]|uniref:SDR family oxidoreductase n=1 Tax=Virgibacillus sp. DJP39 TaxID=3409790 RepID=UPI003BB6BB50
MKVLVVGANGQIGKHLISILGKSEDHTVKAMVRKEEQASVLKKSGIESVVKSLEASVDEIAAIAKDCDAIVFTAGSGGQTDADQTLLIDLDGAAKTIEAAEKVGVKRFIMVSAIQAHRRENWNEQLKSYYVAKHHADNILVHSRLTYTIVRPGGLLNEPGSGEVLIAEDIAKGFIPREDVANTIVNALTEENTYNRSFDLVSGETQIIEALISF